MNQEESKRALNEKVFMLFFFFFLTIKDRVKLQQRAEIGLCLAAYQVRPGHRVKNSF